MNTSHRRVLAARRATLLVLLSLSFLGFCSCERSNRGWELQEEWYGPTQVKSRGYVARNADGNYRRQGKWEFYYSSGRKQGEGSYKDAFAGGDKGSTGILKEGRQGHWIFWYENGQKLQEGTFRDGKEEGLSRTWYENGQKQSQGTYRDDKREGPFVIWYENGQKQAEGTFRNDKLAGLNVIWYENGQKQQEGTFRDGKEEGLTVVWFENGQKQMEGTYKNGELIEDTFRKWDKEGRPIP